MADMGKKESPVEIITDASKVPSDVTPLVTVRTGLTNNQTYFIKINQPAGRAVMIAMHL